ncbi:MULTISPECIES: acetyl-CoA C-acyltransferase [unclassified Beijerinckia]|uniref:acetyl-CoA C-acyltransferase n=1 Tax=unclassified Beijerinckia TaxID=2638183 RepID=UPI00089D3C92|nr:MULTISPECIES: acetyl-CoA C-acyltransferase [unclassified Beijerinckia]MDH7796317.1 acetyl-CoA C-acetyltransferase [Beijerinckia sp. GAS462]SEC39781.1 acetyl-CoA C-acetyltransferase [Beijerinckia sp. 28-YEA-48]
MDAYIVDAVRSPRGVAKPTGALASVKPVHLLAQMLTAVQDRAGFDPEQIDDLIVGCVTQSGDQGANIGKTAALYAGWSPNVSGMTLNRFCASGLTAVNLAAAQAAANEGAVVAGGVEMMSRVPMFGDNGALFTDKEVAKRTNFVHIGLSADLVATQHGFSRAQCDDYAFLSHSRAAAAKAEGRFSRSLAPVKSAEGAIVLEADETVRADVTREKLAARDAAFLEAGAKGGDDRLRALFPDLSEIRHVHHVGNSPQMADGAAAVLVASEKALKDLGLKPRARILGWSEACTAITQTGAVEATRKCLARTGMKIEDIDLFEVRDSFAAVTLHYIHALGIPLERFNVNGSSIALGHPMGATGAMLVSTLLDELERRNARYGLIGIAGAAGVATVTLVENLAA